MRYRLCIQVKYSLLLAESACSADSYKGSAQPISVLSGDQLH